MYHSLLLLLHLLSAKVTVTLPRACTCRADLNHTTWHTPWHTQSRTHARRAKDNVNLQNPQLQKPKIRQICHEQNWQRKWRSPSLVHIPVHSFLSFPFLFLCFVVRYCRLASSHLVSSVSNHRIPWMTDRRSESNRPFLLLLPFWSMDKFVGRAEWKRER